MAKLGATGQGGVNRPALTHADIEVHVRLAKWARDRHFGIEIDSYGNQFMRRAGTIPDALAIVSGSHSDTQPTGGRFDGISGILSAVEALEVIDDAGIATRHPLEIVIWNNEEGVRFNPTNMGSAVYTGASAVDVMLAATDREGNTMGGAVRNLRDAIPWAKVRNLKTPLAAFVELHIEQGPVLEIENLDIGIVTAIQGTRKFEVEIIGDEAHAGTTPERFRRDAFVDAVKIASALRDLFYDPLDILRFTIGRFEVFPGSLAVVPGRVLFAIDLRHPDNAVLKQLGRQVESVCNKAATRCDILVIETRRAHPTSFEGPVPEAIETAAKQRGYSFKHMPSGAGHDARYLNSFCHSGMLFIPCEGGISHNERENTTPEALAKGAQVIADTLLILDERL
jgi:N-carbamoyl-L-amino-acid hydrolase|tara:strand:+ start:842 stop:2029 length:1188 start_codon:yes stop_codon:yes gene_type:complete